MIQFVFEVYLLIEQLAENSPTLSHVNGNEANECDRHMSIKQTITITM